MKIDKGVPLSPHRLRSTLTKTMALMEVGDSIGNLTDARRDCAYRSAQTLEITIKSRKINGEGIRIWRTA